MTTATLPASCYAHPASPATVECGRCYRPICSTCAFESPAGSFCADCMLAGPTVDQRRGALMLGIASVACFGIIFVAVAVGFLAPSAGIVPRSAITPMWTALSLLGFGLTLTGVATGLVGREKGKHSGALLATIGLVANGLLLLLLLLFAVMGSRMKN